ncbi:hypothetical protein P6F26_19615, partial [Roseibacterium sp. SDUM158017]|uniref:hypothetical protein n=1 Tax=Roseicyclus salinarum TaxID=3036773 RepID=UPI002415385D
MTVPGQRPVSVVVASSPQRRWTLALAFALLAFTAIVAARLGVSPILSALLEQASTSRVSGWALLLLYAVLLAIPFVPGAEIGLALLLVFGASMAWPVYVATVLALSIAYWVGRFASRSRLPAPFRRGPPSPAISAVEDGLRHHPWLKGLMRFRWLALALLINMPGNTAIGGGGGIAMAV